MGSITKDPKRRIRRIQRWLCNGAPEFNGIPGYVACHRIESKENCGCFEDQRYECAYCAEVSRRLTDRLERADSLFAIELAWLCDYALRITTEHGRATSRLGEAEGALGWITGHLASVSPGIAQRSAPSTVANATIAAFEELKALRAEKKRV